MIDVATVCSFLRKVSEALMFVVQLVNVDFVALETDESN